MPMELHRVNLHLFCARYTDPNYARMQQYAFDRGFEHAIGLDSNGHVCETQSANVFMVRGGIVYTPVCSPHCASRTSTEPTPVPDRYRWSVHASVCMFAWEVNWRD